MFRINSSGATGDGRFKESPAPATRTSAEWLNMIQDELEAVITAPTGGNAVLDHANSAQLLAAIKAMITRVAAGLGVRKRGAIIGVVGAGTYYHAFDAAFPTICEVVVASPINTTGDARRDVWVQIQAWNEVGFYYCIQSSNTGGVNTCDGITWIAEGS